MEENQVTARESVDLPANQEVKKEIECFNELYDPGECIKDVESWFLGFVERELADGDRESHNRTVRSYRGIQSLLRMCSKIKCS